MIPIPECPLVPYDVCSDLSTSVYENISFCTVYIDITISFILRQAEKRKPSNLKVSR